MKRMEDHITDGPQFEDQPVDYVQNDYTDQWRQAERDAELLLKALTEKNVAMLSELLKKELNK